MSRISGSGSSKNKLRMWLGLFFVALAVPSATLTWQAYSRLKWETFHQYRLLAEELLGRIDRRTREIIAKEEARAFTDYRFLVVEGAPAANYLQRSPLSDFPANSDIPGLLGYFQVDAEGRFTTPLLPDDPSVSALAYGIAAPELDQRRSLRARLLEILSQQGLMPVAESREARYEDGKGQSELVESDEQRAPLTKAAPASASGVPILRDDKRSSLSMGGSMAPDRRRSAMFDSGMPERETGGEVQEQRLAQAAFDRLSEESTGERKTNKLPASVGNIGRVDELKLDRAYDADQSSMQARRSLPRFKERVEFGASRQDLNPVSSDTPPPQEFSDPVQGQGSERETAGVSPALVRMFESEVDPFEFGLLESGHFVLYRKVWRDGRRHIQGAVIEKAALLKNLLETPFRDTALAGMSRLGIVFDGEILSALGGPAADGYLSRTEELSGTLLYRGRFSTPLSQLEMIFSVTSMPSGAAGGLVVWVALTLGLVLSGGLILMYRLGVKQIELSRQQRDFVSAVSHELKTPLTSIRMYSEMLREGWADESRKRSYYDFIHDESERLSRLISNVLQLARMTRDELKVDPLPIGVTQLLDVIRSKVSTQVSHAGFELKLDCSEDAARQTVEVDHDAFAQILINLVDNAIKFAAQADERTIEIGCVYRNDARVEFHVRDHGPGIPKDQMKKIFMLFYRSENELTRETVGTGIGLALVHRLAAAMGGEVDVINCDPGAEFRVRFPVLKL